MGTSRYSRDPARRKREELFDFLQDRCGWADDRLTVSHLRLAGVKTAHWSCRSPECFHVSESFALEFLPGNMRITELRRRYICGRCKTKRPELKLDVEGFFWD